MTAATSQATFPATTDVLVVGAGPTGLALATSLCRLGADVTLVDLGTEIRTDSRAAGVQPRTLQDLDRLDAAGPLIAKGLKGTGFRVANRDGTLLELPYAGLDTPYPFLLLVPQSETEQVLRDALTAAGGRIWSGYRLLELHQEFDAVATLVAGPDGLVHSVRARYVAGCDGLHSGVRGQAGIEFAGQRRPQEYALADVRMTETSPTPRVTFTFSPDGMLLQSPLPDGIVRVVASVPDATGALDRAGVQDLIDRRCGPGDRATVAEIVRSTPYTVTSRLAATFAKGRVFLAGDAAHVHSPAGGQGMNTGIQDAVHLAGLLAQVLRPDDPGDPGDPADPADPADPSILARYDAERRPNAAALLAFTGQLTAVAELSDPEQMRLRDQVLARSRDVPGLPQFFARRLAQLDVPAAGWPAS
ncbi:MAG: FAD-dependent monooxygenase [Actinobacteria bacterium]|nr:FAD-dependent monooxygenase [Actinomycetota bacterium]